MSAPDDEATRAWVEAKPNEYVPPVVAMEAKRAMAAILTEHRANGSGGGLFDAGDEGDAPEAFAPYGLRPPTGIVRPAIGMAVDGTSLHGRTTNLPAASAGADAKLALSLSEQTSMDLGETQTVAPSAPGLADKFLVPSFSVLDTRQDYWQRRRRAWLSLGLRGETPSTPRGEAGGRNRDLTFSSSVTHDPSFYDKKAAKERELGRTLTTAEFNEHYTAPVTQTSQSMDAGTSVFDPVLCEIAYRWFSGPGACVLDPFAGGVVRGLVAGALGRSYTGIELRPEQVADNREQAERLFAVGAGVAWGRDPVMPRWIEHDATRINELALGTFDACVTCPPYADLEVYSNDPRDLSTMPYPKFVELLGVVMKQTVALLKPDSFAVWVVGEARGKHGNEYGFAADTVKAGQAAGMGLYNSAILVNSVGSAALRAQRTFNTRKLTRVHQHVLVFVKGDAKRAARRCGVAALDL